MRVAGSTPQTACSNPRDAKSKPFLDAGYRCGSWRQAKIRGSDRTGQMHVGSSWKVAREERFAPRFFRRQLILFGQSSENC